MASTLRTINGTVVSRGTDRNIPGLRVEAWDKQAIIDNRLGVATTDAGGRFQINIDPRYYREVCNDRKPDVYFRVFKGKKQICSTEDAVLWNVTQPQICVTIPVDLPGVEAVVFRVEGHVASHVSASVGGLQVWIVDKTVGEDVLLGEAVTDEDGAYEVTFTDADLFQQGKARPDLQARVFAGDTLLGASSVRFNASTSERLNVLLDDEASSNLRSEHETLTTAISAHFGGKLRDLKEEDDRQDVTFLANKTGWDARAIALAALADQFSASTTEMNGGGIEPAFFYALFRAGLPVDESALYRTNAATAEAIWAQAIKQGVIPGELEDRTAGAVEQFHRLSAGRTLDSPAMVGVSPLKELLSISLGDDASRQKRFTDLYVRHRNDLPRFWEAVRSEFDESTEQRLRLDGQLAFLTVNNAPIIRKLHAASPSNRLTDVRNLVEHGYYRADKWRDLVGNDSAPPEIPGENDGDKRIRYAETLAAQVRLSFPTAVVAQMVKSGETRLASQGLTNQVQGFLNEHEGSFEIGRQSVEEFVRRNELDVAAEVTKEVARIQRVYQITPDHDTMNVMLKRGVDSAYAVTRYAREDFVRTFQHEMGGESSAKLIFAKSQQVYNAVLNIAMSYLTASRAPGIGVHSPAQIVSPAPHASDVIAQSTLEALLGEMDFCECAHCRSILSPAAYLVDLLVFLEASPPAGFTDPQTVLFDRRPDIQHLPLTCENTLTPIPYIDLVNEVLEYFVADEPELVPPNAGMSLADYSGHTTFGDASPEELQAGPEFVRESAYTVLAGAHFPAPLPFHQSLENLRRYFEKFEAPLPEVMEALRATDDLERANPGEYAWRDILMEELRLSRKEYRLLTDSTLTLAEIYGFEAGTSEFDAVAALSNAKDFTRRIGISYEELIAILRTRFVNPNSTLIPKLERLGVPFSTLQSLKDPDGGITDEEFEAALAPQIDASAYGGDIAAWVKKQSNYDRFMGLITLTNPERPADVCGFAGLKFRYADPDKIAMNVRSFEFVRLLRFVRLWKTLGWSIAQTDQTITALYPTNQIPNHTDDAVNLERLDDGFLALLPRLAVVRRTMKSLKLKPKKDLLPLLACFAPLDTHGASSLYRQLFLSPVLLEHDEAFADNGYGEFLTDHLQRITDHSETLRAAFLLTGDELTQITTALEYDDDTRLGWTPTDPELEVILGHPPSDEERDSLTEYYRTERISAIFRRGWLARRLKLSVREFLLLTRLTHIDPFAAPDAPAPPILRLIDVLDRLRAASLKPSQAMYLIWNEDISGASAPEDDEILSFTRTLRSDLAAIESEFTLVDDSDVQITSERMALVFGNDTTEFFLALIANTLETDVAYSHGAATLFTRVPYLHDQESLGQAILDAASGNIVYDNVQEKLSCTGALTAAIRDQVKAVVGVTPKFQAAVDILYAESQKVVKAGLELPIVNAAPGRIAYNGFSKRLSYSGGLKEHTRDALLAADGVTESFKAAVHRLYEDNQRLVGPLFGRYPELEPLYDTYVASNDTVVAYGHHQPSLDQTILNAGFGKIAYDDVQKRLSYRGRVTEDVRDALKNPEIPVAATSEFKAAVDRLFQEDERAVEPLLADATPELLELYEALVASGETPGQRVTALVKHLLPELKNRRKRQQTLQAMGATAKADAPFATAILENAEVLHADGHNDIPALDDLTASETQGLSVQFFFGNTATGEADQQRDAEADLSYSTTGSNQLPANPAPGDAVSGIWSGYLEAPENGFYKVLIETDAGATATLILGDVPIDLAVENNVWSNNEPIELRAGTLYTISVKIENVRNTVDVRWETTGRGRETIPSRYLYSATLTDHLRRVYVRYLKAASLATALKLTAAEFAYLASHVDYEIDGLGWLNSMPVTGSPEESKFTKLLEALTGLLDYARIKAALAPDDERLLTILRGASLFSVVDFNDLTGLAVSMKEGSDPLTVALRRRLSDETNDELDAYDAFDAFGVPILLTEALEKALTDELTKLVYALIRWESSSLDSLLVRFGKVKDGNADRDALTDLTTLCRVHDAFESVNKLAVPAAVLIKAATNEPAPASVRDFQAALRARYDEKDWLEVLRPINDEMRSLQRNALVAYILHQMSLKTESEHIDTQERLFEYFLIDVGMEPCTMTSRVRLALSSVQLFIERCLMNLEPRIDPSTLDAAQWEWMKRYRVWEANRKVFLWPENWAEPELRDDQSPFFKEAMSELLQGDITDDRAAETLLNYLSKLDEVAKLEPCGMCVEEYDADDTTDDVVHVVARTAGANRKYYYRRREGVAWRPWEQIKLEIEDNPVIPVIWNNRLFLFWLQIQKKSAVDTQELPSTSTPGTPASALTLKDLQTGATDIAKSSNSLNMRAVLCWSEFFNGKWQPTKTSDVERPIHIAKSPEDPEALGRSALASFLTWKADDDGALIVYIVSSSQQFTLYNSNSLPALGSNPMFLSAISIWSNQPHLAVGSSDGTLTLKYRTVPGSSPIFVRDVLSAREGMPWRVVTPVQSPLNSWAAPFLFEDSRHVFYVTPQSDIVKIPESVHYGVELPPGTGFVDLPGLVLKPPLGVPFDPKNPIPGDIRKPGFGVVDPPPIELLVVENPRIRYAIGSSGTVGYGDKEIGVGGAMEGRI